jgi:hypothetical protein
MTLPFPIDNSFQSNFNFFTSNIYDGDATSNYVDNISNLLQTNINTKENTLTAGTNLLGVGSAISALDYNKITINKPSYFPSDWNTTIANKPSTFPANMTNIYSKAETDNLLNTKQATLTASTNLLGIGSSISALDYNNITLNKPTTFPPTMTNIYSKAETDNLLNTKQATLIASTNLLGIGSSISQLDYNKITLNKPTNFQADWNSTIINKPTYFTPDPTLYYNQTQVNNISNFNSNFTTQQSNILNTKINTKQDILTGITNLVGNGSAITALTYGNINGVPNMNLYTPFSALLQSNYVPFTAVLSSNYTSNSTISLTNYTRTGLDPAYLLKSTGGTLTGDVNIEKSNPIVSIKASDESQTSILYLSTPYNITSGLKTAIIAQGFYGWSRSKLHFCLNDNSSDNTTAQNASVSHARMTILPTGNIGIGNITPLARLHITEATGTQQGANSGSIIIDHDNNGGASSITFRSAVNRGSDYGYIQYQDASSVGGGGESAKLIIGTQNDADDDILLLPSGNVGIGIANPTSKLDVNGNIKCSGNLYIATDKWVYSTELKQRFYFAPNARTYYQGYGNISHEFRGSGGTGIFTLTDGGSAVFSGSITANANSSISGDLSLFTGVGGGTGALYCAGTLRCTMQATDNSGTDYVGVANADGDNGALYSRTLFIMFNTFTGLHRCFTNDPLYDNENPQKFKDDYMGRIVVSTGKIATDMKTNASRDATGVDEWEVKYDKEGITIEDALPIIQLSRKKKDKRIFGILGMSSRNNSRAERMIVNSVGEGALWICSSNGNIENGDYIQSSDHLGYGERQDDDILHNYSVAKATMDCNFELDSPLYECREINDGLRVAFIAVTYHSG